MKCTYCSSRIKKNMAFCPNCGQLVACRSIAAPTDSVKKRCIKLAVVIVVMGLLFVPTVWLINFFSFRFIDGYRLETYGAYSTQITYAGDLQQLYREDRNMLYSVMHYERFDGKIINRIQCDDYTITYGGADADILDENITIYKPGLVEYPRPTEGSSFQRFHDYVIVIEDIQSDHKYYFCYLDDVDDWIEDRT